MDSHTVKSFASEDEAKDESVENGDSERDNIMEWPMPELSELSGNDRWGESTKTWRYEWSDWHQMSKAGVSP